MKTYFIAGQEISFPCLFPRLERYQFTGVEFNSTPLSLTVPEKLISCTSGFVANAERIVEIWSAGNEMVLRVAGFRDFYISLGGSAILPVSGSPELTLLEQEVVLGPALVLALALGGKWCLHASAACFQNRGMVFLGESGYGKSTLAVYLDEACKPDWQRIADDILPISLGEGGLTGWTYFPQLKIPNHMQPSLSIAPTILFDRIVQLAPDKSVTTPVLVPLSMNEVVIMLLRNTAGARLFTPELLSRHMSFCAEAARHVAGHRLSYSHQRDILPVVKEMLEKSLRQDKL